ncbi:MAG: methyltransferase domain-containing protein [bacterium]
MERYNNGDRILMQMIVNDHNHYSSILAVGYGRGDFMKRLTLPGMNVTGIDPNGVSVNGFKTHKATAEQFNTNKLYDMIFVLRSFHHLNDPDDAMRNIVSMLAYNGKLYIVDWKAGGGSIKDRLHTIFKKREKHYSLAEAENIVKNSGLEITESYETDSFIVIEAVNTHYTAVFPVKNSALSSIEDADEFIIKTEATDRKTDVMPDYCNVLFIPEPGREEFILRQRGIKVYYSRGDSRDNMNFLNALSNKEHCRWNDTCPVGRRTQRGEISPYWTENYCLINNNDCIRFHMEKRGEYHSDMMLPDGSIYKGDND